MYQIKCDDYILYDPRDEEFTLLNPKIKLEVNTVGEGSFAILPTHPYYDKLKRLKSVFEVSQNGQVIFRGRMTEDSKDFYKRLNVDLEGVLAYANDTIIPAFSFPECCTIAEDRNVVEAFLEWIIDQHNAQASDWQKFKLGDVSVEDPNNYITRSSTTDMSTWECLKTRLFNSALGGYLIVRYESDGNYIDYLADFDEQNTQHVTFGENLLDLTSESDASETYSAILPLGAQTEEGNEGSRLDISTVADGDLSSIGYPSLTKSGRFIYSPTAVENYGWICMPIGDSTWDDVSEVDNLKRKAAEKLTNDGILLSNTITIKAADLHFTDDDIESFHIGLKVLVNSEPHGLVDASYKLTKLDVDLFNPQNTLITIGDTEKSMTSINEQKYSDSIQRVEKTAELIEGVKNSVSEVGSQVVNLETNMTSTAETVVISALETYSETGEFGEFKKSVEGKLETMSDNITAKFTETTSRINSVDKYATEEFEKITKYIQFSIDGITIGSSESGLKLTMDNNIIQFSKGEQIIGYWDAEKDEFFSGNIVVSVNKRAQFGNFAFIPRSDGSLQFLKVGEA